MRKVLQSGATSIGDEKNQCKTFISTWMLGKVILLLALENLWSTKSYQSGLKIEIRIFKYARPV